MAYTFSRPDNSIVWRDDGVFIAWNEVAADGPRNNSGPVFRRWQLDGSPIPSPYVAPAPTADETRIATYLADTDRQNLVNLVKDATPAQIKTYCNNNFPSLTAAERLIIARLIMLVAMTIRS